jgi:phage head maturation protease
VKLLSNLVTEVALVYLPNAADAALLLSKLKAGNLAGSSVNSRFRMRRFDMSYGQYSWLITINRG